MKIGRVHVSGPSVWPDHVLSYETGNLLFGAVVQVRGFAIGLEIQGRHGNPWAYIYLGLWCIEVYVDRDRSWEL